jgi:hypothetical protein
MEKWDGFGRAPSVAVSGPGEISFQNPDAVTLRLTASSGWHYPSDVHARSGQGY